MLINFCISFFQDPYGNYVVQYVLDLGDNRFADSLIRKFIGNVCSLSVQKFSSNVMEKVNLIFIETFSWDCGTYAYNFIMNK